MALSNQMIPNDFPPIALSKDGLWSEGSGKSTGVSAPALYRVWHNTPCQMSSQAINFFIVYKKISFLWLLTRFLTNGKNRF